MTLKKVVATPFKIRDKDTLTQVEFIFSLSRDRDWYNPDEAEKILEAAKERDLLEPTGEEDDVQVQFSVEEVDTTGYSPPDVETITGEQDLFDQILNRLIANGFEKQETVAEINRAKRELQAVNIEAAALYVAKKKGIDVDDLIDEALEDLFE
ncbi:DUF2240 family protein (plasmid) [Halorutilales archaeon Cl-col2-1]